MSSLLAILLKAFSGPVVGALFGSAAAIKRTMLILGVVVIGGVVWYLTNAYGEMKVTVAEQRVTIDNFVLANEALGITIGTLQLELSVLEADYASSNERRATLAHQLEDNRQSSVEALNVFDKECGRLERLMQKKASLIVRLSNRGTSRVRDELEEATTTH